MKQPETTVQFSQTGEPFQEVVLRILKNAGTCPPQEQPAKSDISAPSVIK